MAHLGKHATVIGASTGGLLAARALADYYDQVTVVERDVLPKENEPRKGVPQGRHGVSFFSVKGVSFPVAVSVFPDELYQAPKSWAEQAYPKLIHYNKLPKGEHFAAWEEPQLFSEEVCAGFRSLR